MKEEKIKQVVRKHYGKIVKQESSCCGPIKPCSCDTNLAQDISKKIGYSDEELKAVPEEANLGLGCGNPIAFASLKKGETVLDLGSGAGFDCFLAANKVGKNGKVIGVDMTPEMIEKARENAKKSKYVNVEFRLGELENLPVADSCIDIVISNCVINLVPDKRKVFMECFRVLKPGGRLMISDIVLLEELPGSIKESIDAYVGCLSGAVMKNEYIKLMKEAKFQNIEIIDETNFPVDCITNDPSVSEIIKNIKIHPEEIKKVAGSIVSIKVSGIKGKERG